MTVVSPPTLRVVVADDAEPLRALVCTRLRQDPRFDVVGEAGDGENAVELTRTHHPDAVLLDLSMPGIDGLEALRRIRRDVPNARVVVLSGFRAGEFAADALALGASAYIEKGIELDRVAEVLAEACGLDPLDEVVLTRSDAPVRPVNRSTLRVEPTDQGAEDDGGEEDVPARTSSRVALLGLVALVLATVVALTVTQATARERRLDAFDVDGATTAQVIATAIDETHVRSAQLARVLLGPTPSPDEAQALAAALGAAGAGVADATGTIVTADPANTALIGQDGTGFPHIAAAVAGERTVTALIPAAVQDVTLVAVATPLERGGAVSVGYLPDALHLRGPLEVSSPAEASRVWLVDPNGAVIAAVDRTQDEVGVLPPPTPVEALADDEFGGWVTGVWPVADTPWFVIAAAEESAVYAEVSGALSAVPWVLVALVASAGAVALSLAERSRRDADRLEQANRDLQSTNEDLEQFAYVASHDLQEPLRKVASYCQLLERRYADQLDDTARQYIGFAVDGATRMQQLIGDLLRFSRAGRSQLDTPEPVDTLAALHAAVADLQPTIDATGATVSLPDRLPFVEAEQTHVQQLLQNVLSNALKFHRPGQPPVVKVTGFVETDMVHLSIADEGIGIPPERYEQVFGLFQRLHDTAAYQGTGIGLAICRRLVERYGGRIWATGAEGYGTTIHLTLPHSDPETR